MELPWKTALQPLGLRLEGWRNQLALFARSAARDGDWALAKVADLSPAMCLLAGSVFVGALVCGCHCCRGLGAEAKKRRTREEILAEVYTEAKKGSESKKRATA